MSEIAVYVAGVLIIQIFAGWVIGKDGAPAIIISFFWPFALVGLILGAPFILAASLLHTNNKEPRR